jgi:hypothetical protein
MRQVYLLPIVALTACATAPATPVIAGSAGTCRKDALASFVGQVSTEALGKQMLAASGARALRLVPKGMMVTMDYRDDRLTVYLDAANRVERASCS